MKYVQFAIAHPGKHGAGHGTQISQLTVGGSEVSFRLSRKLGDDPPQSPPTDLQRRLLPRRKWPSREKQRETDASSRVHDFQILGHDRGLFEFLGCAATLLGGFNASLIMRIP